LRPAIAGVRLPSALHRHVPPRGHDRSCRARQVSRTHVLQSGPSLRTRMSAHDPGCVRSFHIPWYRSASAPLAILQRYRGTADIKTHLIRTFRSASKDGR
jgi:hypothetical protein